MGRLKGKLEGKADSAPLPMFTSCCPGWISEFLFLCSSYGHQLLPWMDQWVACSLLAMSR